MDEQPSIAAPEAWSTLKFVTSLVCRSKWLIGGAAIVVAAVAFALIQLNTVQIWTGRTTLSIGLAPDADYMLRGTGAAVTVVEGQRNTIARISDTVFKVEVVSRAAFEPATAAASRSMVSSSLRAVALDGDRDVAVELSAASPADVRAAFREIAAEISQTHGEMLNKRLQLLQTRIDDAKSRIALIEKSSNQLNDRIFNTTSDDKTRPRPSVFAALPAWNELQDRVQHDTTLKDLSEPSVLHLGTGIQLLGPRPAGALGASLLAGLAMLIAMIVLTTVVGSSQRASKD